jgi:hypothetical protein
MQRVTNAAKRELILHRLLPPTHKSTHTFKPPDHPDTHTQPRVNALMAFLYNSNVLMQSQ